MRRFEFPYNFDKKLISILSTLDPLGKTIDCIYVPPFPKDYQTILRNGEQAAFLDSLERKEYEEHIAFINSHFPGKIQILLQKPDIILPSGKIQYYINLGVQKYCVGSIEQAKIIKDIDKNLNVIGSISMQINKTKILDNFKEYNKYFNGFVLPFKASKTLNDLKNYPKNFYYILLINAYCNINCTGKNHWYFDYKSDTNIKCPGILTGNNNSSINWDKSARIRPMDLGFFDPYIYVYKLQDRGWPTADIIRDYVIYTTDFSLYPGINYDERMYYNGE